VRGMMTADDAAELACKRPDRVSIPAKPDDPTSRTTASTPAMDAAR